MSLRWIRPDERRYTIMGIMTEGRLNTRPINWPANTIGRTELPHAYLEEMAVIIGGYVKPNANPGEYGLKAADGSEPELALLLAKAEDWLAAIGRYQGALCKVIGESVG